MSFHQILFVGPHPFASVPPCTYEDKQSIVAGLLPSCSTILASLGRILTQTDHPAYGRPVRVRASNASPAFFASCSLWFESQLLLRPSVRRTPLSIQFTIHFTVAVLADAAVRRFAHHPAISSTSSPFSRIMTGNQSSRQNCVGQPTFEKDVSRAFRRSFVGFNMRRIDASWKDFGFRASFLFGILFDEGELHGQVHSLEGECWIMSASMSFHQILFVGPHPFASVPPCTYEDKRSIVAGLLPS
ncbi:hypothetical protein C8J57DRAFT_1376241, partial [Mycena rebaudengoi]